MKIRFQKINAIGFDRRRNGEELVIYMASINKDCQKVTFFEIPSRCRCNDLLNEFCINSIGITYHEVINAINNFKGDANAMWVSKNRVVFSKIDSIDIVYKQF